MNYDDDTLMRWILDVVVVVVAASSNFAPDYHELHVLCNGGSSFRKKCNLRERAIVKGNEMQENSIDSFIIDL